MATIRYPELFPPEDESYHPLAFSRNLFIEHVDHRVAKTIMAALEASDATMRAVQLRPVGGAVARVPAEATAYAHRNRRIMVNIASFYEGEADRPIRMAWVDELWTAMAGGDQAAYVNFLGDEGPDRVRAAVSRSTLGPPARDQGPLRSGQPVPLQPEHPAGHSGVNGG